MNQQLTLAVQLNDQATLHDFNWQGNTPLQQFLMQTLAFSGEHFLYLWGTQGCGKTHLLQASCQALGAQYSSIYLPLTLLKEWGADSLEGLGEQDLICIDDIEAIAGNPDWEQALFRLYNQVKDNEKSLLIITSRYSPTALPIHLADLRSRLAWGLTVQIQELCDDDKIDTLIIKAHKRGIELSESVAQYLIHHCSRNMLDLMDILNQLDKASLIEKRKITIPFVKSVLGTPALKLAE